MAQEDIAMAAAPQPGTSQVFLRDTGLRFDAEGVDVLHYDHASRLLLAVRRSSIAVYNVDRPSQPAEVIDIHAMLSHCGARTTGFTSCSLKCDHTAQV